VKKLCQKGRILYDKPTFIAVWQNTVQKYPHKLFLIDACGALLTAVLVGMVLPAFPHYILMPTSILQSLAAVAGVFALYSAACT